MMRRLLLLALFLIITGCSNVLRSGLMNDTSILLPPNHEKTIYVQVRNTSENQLVTPTDLAPRLSAKGYQVVADPQQAAYWLQTQVVYYHKPGDDVMPEAIAKSGFGAGLGSGGTPLQSAGGGDLMSNLKAQNAIMAQTMQSMKAMMAQLNRGGGTPPKPEGIAYLCVADVLVTERGKGAPAAGAQLKTYKMRSVAHILQKDVNVEEATPILRNKFSTGITGLF
jgi:Enterobacterial TraT complement resistance protein